MSPKLHGGISISLYTQKKSVKHGASFTNLKRVFVIDIDNEVGDIPPSVVLEDILKHERVRNNYFFSFSVEVHEHSKNIQWITINQDTAQRVREEIYNRNEIFNRGDKDV